MKHLEDRLIEEGLSNISVQEILQYVRDLMRDEYEAGYEECRQQGCEDLQ